MKTLILQAVLIFSSCSFLAANKYQYWIETTPLDTLYIIEGGKKRLLHSDRTEKDRFFFETSSRKNILQAKCKKCSSKDSLSIKLLEVREDQYTPWIILNSGGMISIEQCFAQVKKKGRKGRWRDWVTRAKDFIQSARIGRIGSKGMILKGPNDATILEPAFSFIEWDSAYFWDQEDFLIQFERWSSVEVKTISIISHDVELVFCAGDISILGILFDLEGVSPPAITDVVKRPTGRQGNTIRQMIDWESIKNQLISKFKPGTWYQFSIDLGEQEDENNTYHIDFQFMDSKQKSAIEDVLKKHG